jgi:hypothetical protein
MSVFGSGDTYSQELYYTYEKDKIANEQFLEEQRKKAIREDQVKGQIIFNIASKYYEIEETEYFEKHPELSKRNYIWPLEVERAHAAERQARYDRSIARAKAFYENGTDSADDTAAAAPAAHTAPAKGTVKSSITKKTNKKLWKGGKQRKSRNQRKRKSTKQRRSMKHRK